MSQEFTDKTYQEIEAYLLQSMPKEEMATFEQRMANDDLLRQEVVLHRSLHQSFNENDWSTDQRPGDQEELVALTAKLNSDEYKKAGQNITEASEAYFKRMEKNTASPKRLPLYKIGIAATILLLIALLFLWPDPSLESQYIALADWEDVPSLVEKGDAQREEAGEVLLRAQQYQEVVEHYSAAETRSPYSLIYLGIAYLELDQTDQALDTFDKLLASGSIESSRAHWYKLLVYVKTGNQAQVKATLTTILSSEQNYNYEEALSLSKVWKKMLEE